MKKTPRKKEKVQKILEAAARLFGSKGFLDTAMRDIVAASAASKGAIYYYFPQKEDMLFEVLDSYLDCVLQDLETELQSLPNAEAGIRYLIRRHIRLYVENVYAAKTLLHEAAHLPSEKFERIAAKQREYFRIAAGVLAEYAGGKADAPRLTAITFTLFGMCNWIYSWYRPEKTVTPDDLADIIFQTFTRGVSQAWKTGIETPVPESQPTATDVSP